MKPWSQLTGLEPWNYDMTFQKQLGMSSSQLTFTPSFFRGVRLKPPSSVDQLVQIPKTWMMEILVANWPGPQAFPKVPGSQSGSLEGPTGEGLGRFMNSIGIW